MDQVIIKNISEWHRFHCVSPEVYVQSEYKPELSYKYRKAIASKVCANLLKNPQSQFAIDYMDFLFRGKCRSEFKSIAGLIRVYDQNTIVYSIEGGLFIKLEV